MTAAAAPAAFNPDAYLAAKEGGGVPGFDPDAYLEAKGETQPLGEKVSNTIRGYLDMVPFSHKFIAAVEGRPVASVDQQYEAAKDANPVLFNAGRAGALLSLPGPKGIKGMAALGAAQAAGDTRGGFGETLANAGLGAVLGGTLGAGFKLAGKGIGAVADKALPYLERLKDKFAGKVLDASTRPAEATLKSATGTLGSLTAEGSRTLERLGMDAALPPAEKAANAAALSTPEAQALATDLAGKARGKLAEMLPRIEAGRGTVAQATADLAAAKTPEALAATEQRMRDYANDTLLKRYLLPGAAGAASGWAFGGEDAHGLGATTGLGLGLGARPMLRAIVRQASNPGYAAPLTRAAVSTAERLAGMATSQPELLGKFAAPLTRALERGPDSLAATHFVLSQDGDYQKLMHDAAEGQQ